MLQIYSVGCSREILNSESWILRTYVQPSNSKQSTQFMQDLVIISIRILMLCLWTPKTNQITLESNWIFAPNLKNFPQGDPEILRVQEWDGQRTQKNNFFSRFTHKWATQSTTIWAKSGLVMIISGGRFLDYAMVCRTTFSLETQCTFREASGCSGPSRLQWKAARSSSGRIWFPAGKRLFQITAVSINEDEE